MSWGDRLAFARDRDVTLGTLLQRLAAVGPNRCLVSEDGASMTYGDAADLVARWAGHLDSRISPGDRVVVATPNSYRVLLMCLAVCRAGGVAVPVNMRMPAAEIDHVVAEPAPRSCCVPTTRWRQHRPWAVCPPRPPTSPSSCTPRARRVTRRGWH